MNEQPRETYATRLGFFLGLLGGAIGMGNVWRFSYMAGTNGGSAFFIPYITAVVVVGIPLLMLELAYGRHFKGGPVTAHAASGLPAGRSLGVIVMLLALLGFSYYMVLISWTLKYFTASFTEALWRAEPQAYFADYVHRGWQRFAFHFATVMICASVILLGVRKGLEPVTKYMVIGLFLLLLGLASYSLMLPGAVAGLKFLFVPDLSKITATTWLMALGQIFFSIGIGGSVIITYGSYMQDHFDIPRTAVLIVLGDTVAAILCGIVIFPAVFAMGSEPAGGIGLVFFTLPRVFADMPAGQFAGAAFFTGFLFAALSTGLFAVEFLAEPLIYVARRSRRQAVALVAVALWLLGIPWVYNIDWLSLLDIFNVVLSRPLTSILVPVGFLWLYSAARAHAEVNKGARIRVGAWWPLWTKYALPAVILVLYVWGILELAARP